MDIEPTTVVFFALNFLIMCIKVLTCNRCCSVTEVLTSALPCRFTMGEWHTHIKSSEER